MDNKRTREALAQFLDYLGAKGLMPQATVQARKATASKVLGILQDSEADDVTSVDVEDVMRRFGHLHGQQYTPGSLATYQSRLRATLDDFRSYLSNPLAFRPAPAARPRTVSKAAKNASTAPRQEVRSEPSRSNPVPMATANILPIPLRADLTVYIQGLPFDLSEAEAKKIAAVVTAMAQ
jgi:site-specific recombinase XerC